MSQQTLTHPNQVVDWLRHLHGLRHDDKHENWLISPALFNPTLGETSRGTENVILAWGIWLDVDGGDLPYPQFQRMFPGVRMVIFNTWSSLDDTRYRVLIPTTGYMLTDTYKALCQEFVEVVKAKGYCSPRQKERGSKKPCHGIDLGKTTAANMMYLPCQPGPGGAAFFEVYDGDPVDPALWLRNSVVPVRDVAGMTSGDLGINVGAVADVQGGRNCALTLLDGAASRIASSGTGGRNNALFSAAMTCFAFADAGLLTHTEVEHTLSGAASRAGLDRSEIRSTLHSARNHAWKKADFARRVGSGVGKAA